MIDKCESESQAVLFPGMVGEEPQILNFSISGRKPCVHTLKAKLVSLRDIHQAAFLEAAGLQMSDVLLHTAVREDFQTCALRWPLLKASKSSLRFSKSGHI